jgi:hypothetical protein
VPKRWLRPGIFVESFGTAFQKASVHEQGHGNHAGDNNKNTAKRKQLSSLQITSISIDENWST